MADPICQPWLICLSVPRASWIHVVRLPSVREVGPLLAARNSAPMWIRCRCHLDVSNYGQENEWVLLSCLLSDRAVHWSV